MTQNILKDYDQLFFTVANANSDTFLPSNTTGVCRFCGQSSPNVTFRKRAHAISELLGNHHLLSDYECDACNAKFSQLEREFSQFMLFYNAVLRIEGKKGTPIFKPYRNQFSSISTLNGGLNIQVQQGDQVMHKINWRKKTLVLYGNRTYIPIDVYRCLLKMALTVMPESEMPNLGVTMDFLNGVTELPQYRKMCAFKMYGGGSNIFRYPVVMLYKKKASSTADLPTYIFGLAYANFLFQLPILACSLDGQIQQAHMLNLPVIPTIADGEFPVLTQSGMIDLSSHQKIVKEPVNLLFSFEYATGTWLCKWQTIVAYYLTECRLWIQEHLLKKLGICKRK